jgi:hypothetical protein
VEALQQLCARQCRVMRDGKAVEIDAARIVPGDVLLLEEGDIVAADARLIEANQVEVDNSSLTGESESAKRYKSDRPVLLHGKFLWIELPNVVFAGSVIVRGTARAIVFGTGMNSEIGKIAGLTQAIAVGDSPLQKQLRGTVLAISLLAGSLGIGFLLLGWLVAGLTFVQAFVFFYRHFRRQRARRAAAHRHPFPGHGRHPDGGTQRGGQASFIGGNPGLHHGDLFGQNRHPHPEPRDGFPFLGRRSAVPRYRRRVPARGAFFLGPKKRFYI